MFILCSTTEQVSKLLLLNTKKYQIKISSRCLKHLYDRKPAEEFIFLLDNLYEIVRNPMYVYFNKSEKRGTFGLVKNVCGSEYFCSVETTKNEIQVATVFRLRDSSYLKNYTLLWSWKDGDLPRNVTNSLRDL